MHIDTKQGPFKKIDITPNMKKEIGMVAGGTGITPMYQVIHEVLAYYARLCTYLPCKLVFGAAASEKPLNLQLGRAR